MVLFLETDKSSAEMCPNIWYKCIIYIWKIKIIILYTWMTHLVIHCKHYHVMGILATLDLISVQFLSIIFKEHCMDGYGLYVATGAESLHLSDLLYTCSRGCFPWTFKTHMFTCFLYNSAFIVCCTFPLYFSNPAMSCLIWIDKNRTLCSEWNPTREMYYSHHYHCLRHRANLLWMLF